MLTKLLFVVAMAIATNGQLYQRTPLGDSIDKASIKLLNEAYKLSENKNVVASPLSVMLLLSLYSEGAGPQSREQISQFLGGGDYKQITESYSDLSKKLAEQDPSYLTLANKIYVSNKYTVDDAFSTNVKSYESEVEPLDFADTVTAAAAINHWADEKTKGHIKDAIDAKTLDPNTIVALFNVIFFQGHWHIPFRVRDTQEKDFHIDNSTTVKKPAMHLKWNMFYTENTEIGFKMVELPYKEAGFRMILVLPYEIEGLSKVLEKVAESGLLTDVYKLRAPDSKVILDLPKFEVMTKLNLNLILPKVGVASIFAENAPGIVKDSSVKVSESFQKAFIKVDEEGATAGGLTGIFGARIAKLRRPPPIEFKVDHPFLYLILHEDKVIFAGTYTH